MSDPLDPPTKSRFDRWRTGLWVSAPIAIVVGLASAVWSYIDAVSPYPKCYPNCAELVTPADQIASIAVFAAPVLIVLGVIALVVRARLPILAKSAPRDRQLSVAILVLVCVIVGGVGCALLEIIELLITVGGACQAHGC